MVMASSAIRYPRPSEERFFISLTQQIVENPEADPIPDTIAQAATALTKFESC
jgi:hypothetical protein